VPCSKRSKHSATHSRFKWLKSYLAFGKSSVPCGIRQFLRLLRLSLIPLNQLSRIHLHLSQWTFCLLQIVSFCHHHHWMAPSTPLLFTMCRHLWINYLRQPVVVFRHRYPHASLRHITDPVKVTLPLYCLYIGRIFPDEPVIRLISGR